MGDPVPSEPPSSRRQDVGYEYLCKLWTQTPDRFTLNPIHQMPGLNI